MKNSVPPRPKAPPKLLSFVIPLYNEAEVLPILRKRLEALTGRLECAVEWVLVNDGSIDETGDILLAWSGQDDRAKVIDFSRNFGHQAAVTAGLDHAAGDAIMILDGDLQDPPELALAMVDGYKQGYDVVLAKRVKREGENWVKRATAKAFYWIMRKLVPSDLIINEGDFCLLSRAAARAVCELREGHRFIRGLVGWIGFPHTTVEFERPARQAGQTKFPFRRMLHFAWDAILSFSIVPLRMAILAGTLVFFFGMGYGIFGIVIFYLGRVVHGWTSLVVLQSMIGGAILLCLGLMGEYIGRTFEELKGRPLYVVRETANLAARVHPTRVVMPPESTKAESTRMKKKAS